jgi:DNA-binding PadR family transcriptional regulator
MVPDGAMREPTFLILTALAAERLHGYGVMLTVESLSGGRVRLRPGTVYGALDRLEADGLVAPDGEALEQGRVRRYYRLTADGKRALAAETERMAANVRCARERLAGPGPREQGWVL